MSALEVHTYDGKLRELAAKVTPRSTKEEKVLAFGRMRSQVAACKHLEPQQKEFAVRALDQIVVDIGAAPNYDQSNDAKVDDVLYAICDRVLKDPSVDIMGLVAEQLADMIGGMCPPGRVTRLLQLWQALDK